jgi:hypothetical protein
MKYVLIVVVAVVAAVFVHAAKAWTPAFAGATSQTSK